MSLLIELEGTGIVLYPRIERARFYPVPMPSSSIN
jgi:hypothetical protein